MGITKLYAGVEGDPLNSSGPQIRDTVNQLIEAHVNNLKTLPTAVNAQTDTVYNVIGFYANTKLGGGRFIWNPTANKSTHNGGTIIAPEAISAWNGTQADIATLLNWTGSGSGCWVRSDLQGFVTPEMFGAVGDGVSNDNSSMLRVLNSGYAVEQCTGTYLYNQIDLNSPSVVCGTLRLKYNGLATPSGVASFRVYQQADWGNVLVECATSAGEAYNIIEVYSNNFSAKNLTVTCGSQRSERGGCEFFGSNVNIGKFSSKNIARPMAFNPVGSATNQRESIGVNIVEIDNYIRGVKFAYIDGFYLGSLKASGRWVGVAAGTPGHNGLLIESCVNFNIPLTVIHDSLEHGIRIGGSGNCSNFSFGTIQTKDTAGCGVKFNVDPGYLAKNFSVGSVVADNSGEGSSLGNKESVRLTRVSDFEFGPIISVTFASKVLTLADATDGTFNGVSGENVSARIINFDDGQDTSSLNCSNLRFYGVSGVLSPSARAAIGANYAASGRALSGIYMDIDGVTGYSNFLVSMPSTVLSGAFVLNAKVPSSAILPKFEGVPAGGNTFVNIIYGTRQYTGPADTIEFASPSTFASAGFSPTTAAASPDQRGQNFFANTTGAGAGSYGGHVVFSRAGSNGRRGAAVAAKQITSDDKEVGLAFFVQDNTTTANEAMQERMVLKHTGTLWLQNLSVFADNATAISAGLVAGDMYRTTAGELRLVV